MGLQKHLRKGRQAKAYPLNILNLALILKDPSIWMFFGILLNFGCLPFFLHGNKALQFDGSKHTKIDFISTISFVHP